MPDKGGQSRLKKLFHRRDGGSGSHGESTSSPPSSSPNSPNSPSQPKLRKSSSRASLRDIVRGNGRRSSQVSRPNTAEASPGAQAAADKRAGQRTPSSRDGGITSGIAGLNVADGDETNDSSDRFGSPQHIREHSPPSIDNTNGDSFYNTHQYPRHTPRSTSNQHQYPLPGGGATSPNGTRKMHPDDVFTSPRAAPTPPGSSGGGVSARSPTQSQKPVLPEIPRVSADFPTMKDYTSPAAGTGAGAGAVSKHTRQSSSIYSKDTPLMSKREAPVVGSTVPEGKAAPDAGVHSELGRDRGYLVRDSSGPVDLKGIVDLRKTEDTTLHERWAPAVTRETIRRTDHHIREERITREIHQHHYHHRILPIIDIEVLPARHFMPTGTVNPETNEATYVEISADEVPGRTGENAQWAIAEMASKRLPKNPMPRNFTARKFEGEEYEKREWKDEKGVERSAQWWVHHPELEYGGRVTGQTVGLHMGSENPRENGVRARLPAGRVVGISPILAKQREEGVEAGKSIHVDGNGPPPVPVHQELPGKKAFL